MNGDKIYCWEENPVRAIFPSSSGRRKPQRILISVLLAFGTFVSLNCSNFCFEFDNLKLYKTKALKNILTVYKKTEYLG